MWIVNYNQYFFKFVFKGNTFLFQCFRKKTLLFTDFHQFRSWSCMPSVRETIGKFLWDRKWERQILQRHAGNWTKNPGPLGWQTSHSMWRQIPAPVEMVNVDMMKALHHFHLILDFVKVSITFCVLGEGKQSVISSRSSTTRPQSTPYPSWLCLIIFNTRKPSSCTCFMAKSPDPPLPFPAVQGVELRFGGAASAFLEGCHLSSVTGRKSCSALF